MPSMVHASVSDESGVRESHAKTMGGICVHLLSDILTGFSTFPLKNLYFSHTISVLKFRLFFVVVVG